MSGDVTVQLPEPATTGPIKNQMYQYRGETIAIGGTIDWIIHRLAQEFAGSSQPTTARRWDDVKGYLRQRQLTDRVQRELQAVAECFKARELAAHTATVVAQVAESTQIFRLYYDGPTHNVQLVTIDDLEREAQQARAGYEACQSIGQVLDDDRPEVLAGMGVLARAMLLGRT